jgi:hypothetical protein
VAFLPILLLFAGSIFVWLVRKRNERVRVTFGLGTALLVWIVSLGLISIVPNVTSLSVWRPTILFASRLELHLDSIGWIFLYGTSTVIISVLFTDASRSDTVTSGSRSIILTYAALAMTAMLAGNLLTVVTSWALLDIWTFIVLLNMQGDVKSPSPIMARLAVNGGSVLLALAVTLIEGSGGGSSSLTAPFNSPAAAVLLTLASLFRLGLLPPYVSDPHMPAGQRGLGALLRLLPPVVALAVLARMMNIGVPQEALPWLRLAGGIGVVVGGLRWSMHADIATGHPFLILGVSGIGVLVASISSSGQGAPLTAAGFLLLMAGVILSLSEVYAPYHRMWPGIAGLMLAGMPGTPGGVIADVLASEIIGGGSILLALLSILGFIMIAAGSFRLIFLTAKSWSTADSLRRMLFNLGLALPFFVSIGVGLRMPGSFSLRALVIFVASVALAYLVLFWLRRLPGIDVNRWNRLLSWLDPSPIYNAIWNSGLYLIRAIRTLGDILEGEGAMLWMLVILVLLYLALGRTFV